MKKVFIVAALAMIGGIASADFVNGSFETGDFTGWDVSYANQGSSLFVYPGWGGVQPSDGQFLAVFGDVAQQDDTISQTLSTVAGQEYNLSFDFGSSGQTEPLENFTITWDNITLYNAPAPPLSTSTLASYSYIVYGTGSDTASFGGYNLFSNTGLDNVHLTPVATPEPVSCLALAGGVACLLRRRRKG